MVQEGEYITDYLRKIENIDEKNKLYSLYKNDILLKKIVGLVRLSSKNTKTCKNKNYVYKLCNPIFDKIPQFYVKINRKYNYIDDKYAIINLKLENNKLIGTIEKYICNVNEDIENYKMFLESVSQIHYHKKYDKFINDNINNYEEKKEDFNKIGITFEENIERKDLTNLYAFSIDPKDCIDIDDAISYETIDNIHKIYIHISDPSSYIIENSYFDNELLNRTESIYLNHKTIHMIPYNFMKIMSLIKDEKKRAITTIFTIKNKKIIDFEIVKSMVKLNNNYSYEEFDNKELVDIVNKISNEKIDNSKKMVEYLMVLTNHYVCKFLVKNKGNVIVRIQDKKNIIDSKINKNSKYYNDYLKIQNKKAQYKLYTDDCYHYSLNLKEYTHYTSPIRRYVDILIHRLLSNYISKDKYENEKLENKYVETIFKINDNKSRMKKIYDMNNIYEISKYVMDNIFLEDREIVMKGIIINKDEDKIYVKLEKNDNNEEEKIKMIEKMIINMEKIFIIETDKEFDIFENINVKITFLKKNFNKMRLYL